MNEILKQNKTAFYVFDVKTLKDRVAYLKKNAFPKMLQSAMQSRRTHLLRQNLKMMLTALKSAHRVRLKSAIYLIFPTK